MEHRAYCLPHSWNCPAIKMAACFVLAAGMTVPVRALAQPLHTVVESQGLAMHSVSTDTIDSSIQLNTRQFRFLDASEEDGAMVWTSSNEDVATVSAQGLVEARGVGSAEIAGSVDGTVVAHVAVTVTDADYASDFDVMQDRWLRRVVGAAPGDGPLDSADEALVSYAWKQIEAGRENWKTLHTEEGRATLWDKIPSDTVSANYTSQLKKLKTLAVAFGINLPGNDLYQNPELLNDILNALDFFVQDMKYGSSDWEGNWWDYQIGCPGRLADILMIVSDYVDYGRIEPVVKAVQVYCREPQKQLHATQGWVTATGSNLTDIANAMLAMSIVSHDDSKLDVIREQVPTTLVVVEKGDGIYTDGSVVQHTAQAYTGSYGNELLKGIGKVVSIMGDTEFAMTDDRVENLYYTLLNGYIPLMHGSCMMSMVSGRSVARVQDSAPFSAEKYWGNETIANMLMVGQTAPAAYKSVYLAAAKGWLIEAGDFYFQNARDFDALLQARALVEDETVRPLDYQGMHVYGSMDRVVQQAAAYDVGLSMYSSRIYNYECMNKENLHGWHTGSGMLYIYNDGTGAQDDGYWPTIDPYRLPGTTVDTRELDDGAATAKLSTCDWVGGSTDGSMGAAGMEYDASSLGLDMDLVAKKSYFFLNGSIVELGSSITGTTPASIETTIDNRVIDASDTRIMVNGSAWDGAEQVDLSAGDCVTLSAGKKTGSMAYVMLSGSPVQMAVEERTGSYADINPLYPYAEEYTQTYFKIGINHGQQVRDAGYAFAILPGASQEEAVELSKQSSVEVLRNDAQVHAISSKVDDAVMANVWATDGAEVQDVSVDGTASMVMKKNGDSLSVTVSDPTHTRDALTVAIDGALDTVACDEGVTDNGDGSYTIDTRGAEGASYTFVVSVEDAHVPMTDLEPSVPVDAQSTPTTGVAAQQKGNAVAGSLPETGDSATWVSFAAVAAAGSASIGMYLRKRQ